MKKVLSVIMALALSVSLFTACGGNEATASYDVNEVVAAINEAVPVAMAGDLTEEELTMMVGINAEDMASWAGKYSMANVSADRLIVIEAAEGKVDVVKTALEAYRDNVAMQFELYLAPQYEKAKAGRVVVKGNYVVLAILGDAVVVEDEGVDAAYVPVDAAIDEAFK